MDGKNCLPYQRKKCLTFAEMNSVLHKVQKCGFVPMSSICVSSYAYHFTDELHTENPKAIDMMSNGHAYDLKSNVPDKLPKIFLSAKPTDSKGYLRVLGRSGNQRVIWFIKRKYIATISNTDTYKVIISAATGTGQFGETLAEPVIGTPGMITTETFSSMGSFSTEQEAQNCIIFIKSKFVRALLDNMK